MGSLSIRSTEIFSLPHQKSLYTISFTPKTTLNENIITRYLNYLEGNIREQASEHKLNSENTELKSAETIPTPRISQAKGLSPKPKPANLNTDSIEPIHSIQASVNGQGKIMLDCKVILPHPKN